MYWFAYTANGALRKNLVCKIYDFSAGYETSEHCAFQKRWRHALEVKIYIGISMDMNSHKGLNSMENSEPLADPVPVAAMRLGICRAKLYLELAAGRIIARKAGRRTLIERTEQARWLTSLPVMGAPA